MNLFRREMDDNVLVQKNYLDKFILKTLIYLQYFKDIHNIIFVNSTFHRRREPLTEIPRKKKSIIHNIIKVIHRK